MDRAQRTKAIHGIVTETWKLTRPYLDKMAETNLDPADWSRMLDEQNRLVGKVQSNYGEHEAKFVIDLMVAVDEYLRKETENVLENKS